MSMILLRAALAMALLVLDRVAGWPPCAAQVIRALPDEAWYSCGHLVFYSDPGCSSGIFWSMDGGCSHLPWTPAPEAQLLDSIRYLQRLCEPGHLCCWSQSISGVQGF